MGVACLSLMFCKHNIKLCWQRYYNAYNTGTYNNFYNDILNFCELN